MTVEPFKRPVLIEHEQIEAMQEEVAKLRSDLTIACELLWRVANELRLLKEAGKF